MKFQQTKNANYYDLVKIPHGHIPAPMIKFWGWLPIPIKGNRDYDTFHCPTCGCSSFYKTGITCRYCDFRDDDNEQVWKKHQKREKNRKKWKRFEHAILPLLILFGKAWYMPSVKLTYLEQVKKYGPPVHQSQDEWELEMKHEPLGKKCSLCGCELTQWDDHLQQDHPQCCEEHGDFLDLCESCQNWFGNKFEGTGCIREAFYGKSIVSAGLRRDTE